MLLVGLLLHAPLALTLPAAVAAAAATIAATWGRGRRRPSRPPRRRPLPPVGLRSSAVASAGVGSKAIPAGAEVPLQLIRVVTQAAPKTGALPDSSPGAAAAAIAAATAAATATAAAAPDIHKRRHCAAATEQRRHSLSVGKISPQPITVDVLSSKASSPRASPVAPLTRAVQDAAPAAAAIDTAAHQPGHRLAVVAERCQTTASVRGSPPSVPRSTAGSSRPPAAASSDSPTVTPALRRLPSPVHLPSLPTASSPCPSVAPPPSVPPAPASPSSLLPLSPRVATDKVRGRVAAAASSPAIPCGICLEVVSSRWLTICGGDDCGHSYCTSCLGDYVRSRLANRTYPVTCPAAGCGVPLPYAMCAALLHSCAGGRQAAAGGGNTPLPSRWSTFTAVATHEAAAAEAAKATAAADMALLDATHIQATLIGTLAWCSNVTCGTPFEYVPPPWAATAAADAAAAAAAVHRVAPSRWAGAGIRAGAVAAANAAAAALAAAYRVVCPLCATGTCVRCRAGGHPGRPCRRAVVPPPGRLGDLAGASGKLLAGGWAADDEQNDVESGGDDSDTGGVAALAAAAVAAGWRSCPRCGALIERPPGSCAAGHHPACGATWCWTCGDVGVATGAQCACTTPRPLSALPCAGWPAAAAEEAMSAAAATEVTAGAAAVVVAGVAAAEEAEKAAKVATAGKGVAAAGMETAEEVVAMAQVEMPGEAVATVQAVEAAAAAAMSASTARVAAWLATPADAPLERIPTSFSDLSSESLGSELEALDLDVDDAAAALQAVVTVTADKVA